MLIIADEREVVRAAYKAAFIDAGVSVAVFDAHEFDAWLRCAADVDLQSAEGVLVGNLPSRDDAVRVLKRKLEAPVMVLMETPALEQTLSLFAAGADDVVRKPVHPREILARLATIRRRGAFGARPASTTEGLAVFFDGRDPEIDGEPLVLPRRERRILEYLVTNAGRRVTKTQIFNSIYGLFDEDVDECVVESHVSKLRKKLRARLGFDPIDAKRFLGYLYTHPAPGGARRAPAHALARREEAIAA